ncbi:MAG: ABC transporter ATP-binding protein [Nitrososphaeria archaeon]|nr:ABC transporter ATP-binding protein [Nitrososphaeria archaeon]
MSLIKVKNLKMYFPIKRGFRKPPSLIHAVDDVSFDIRAGETLGLVGESGSGKTTCGKCVLRILEPTGGEIFFEGKNILALSNREFKSIRPMMQMVFQDPFLSLNPRKTLRNIIGDPFKLHTNLSDREIESEVKRLLVQVGLNEAFIDRYPHELSGGQKQRVAIARAIALNPKFIFLDEPTSSLDVSVQAQILNLLNDIQKEYKIAYLFVTHNIHLIKFMADRLAIMYLGKILEYGQKSEIFNNPLHPYTKALFSAAPIPDPDIKVERIILRGEIPTPIDPPPGCRFFKRCWLAEEGLCNKIDPELVEVAEDHYVACLKVK